MGRLYIHSPAAFRAGQALTVVSDWIQTGFRVTGFARWELKAKTKQTSKQKIQNSPNILSLNTPPPAPTTTKLHPWTFLK